jgi:hypothetical protein
MGELVTRMGAAIDRLDMGDVTNKLFNALENSNYSEYGKLLREGTLSQEAYLAGNIIEGIFKAHTVQVEAHSRMQAMLLTITQDVVTKEFEFRQRVADIVDARGKLFTEAAKQIDEQLKEANKMVKEALMMIAEAMKTKNLDDKELALASKELAMEMVSTVKNAQTCVRDISVATGIDPRMLIECVASSERIITALMNTSEKLLHADDTALQTLIKTGKDGIAAILSPIAGAGTAIGRIGYRPSEPNTDKDKAAPKKEETPSSSLVPTSDGDTAANAETERKRAAPGK